jgi:hypothetical protein
MRYLVVLAGLLFAMLGSSPSRAWGSSGHRTVCEIALRNLTPAARAEVSRLLASQVVITTADPLNLQLGWACAYPDRTVPGGPTRRDPEHFVNYPRTLLAVTQDIGCGAAHECVDNAVLADLAILRSTAAADRHRAVALMYLGHWVGDIHQPLHNSFEDDRGGGRVNTSGLCTDGLHNAWDSCILQKRVLGTSQNPAIPVLQQLAASWSAVVTDTQRAEWLSSAPWQWSLESYAITTRPDVQYCVMVQATCRYSTGQEAFGGTSPRTVVIDDAYALMAVPLIQRRITQAGVRLAHLINTALDPAYQPGW